METKFHFHITDILKTNEIFCFNISHVSMLSLYYLQLNIGIQCFVNPHILSCCTAALLFWKQGCSFNSPLCRCLWTKCMKQNRSSHVNTLWLGYCGNAGSNSQGGAVFRFLPRMHRHTLKMFSLLVLEWKHAWAVFLSSTCLNLPNFNLQCKHLREELHKHVQTFIFWC